MVSEVCYYRNKETESCMTSEPILNKKGEPVFLYDRHMPKTDDIELIVLKGHLLVEEVLNGLAQIALPNPQYLPEQLMFQKLACVVRAVIPQRSNDLCWELILKLNALRNDLAHNLSSSKRQQKLTDLLALAQRVQPNPTMIVDKSGEDSLSEAERLRHVIGDCMTFLLFLTFDYENSKPDRFVRFNFSD